MEQTPVKPMTPKRPQDREARLKAALKANMAKRKAQARARADKNEKQKE
jgi:hypothetical protein